MLSKVKIENGAISNLNLPDGEYLIHTVSLKVDRSISDIRGQYFLWLGIVSSYSGESKEYLHEQHKKHCSVDTTKNFNSKEWEEFLYKVKWSIFEKYEIAL